MPADITMPAPRQLTDVALDACAPGPAKQRAVASLLASGAVQELGVSIAERCLGLKVRRGGAWGCGSLCCAGNRAC